VRDRRGAVFDNRAGNEFTLRLTVRFKPAFAGHKTVYMKVYDQSASTAGWQSVGGGDVP
jgi:hypothetical protein